MPRKRRPKIDANALKAFRRAQASAPAPDLKPESKTNLGDTAQRRGAKRKPEITERDVRSLRPPDPGTGRVARRTSYLLVETGFERSLSERTRLRGGKWKWYLP